LGGLDSDKPVDFAWIMIITVGVTTLTWLAVTFLTRPERDETLVAFYRRTRPARAGWGPIAARAPDVQPSTDGLANLVDWVAGWSGVSQPSARLEPGGRSWRRVNSATVSARTSYTLSHAPPFSSMAAKRAKSSALENNPACPETPSRRPAFSSCTSPRSRRR